MIKRIKTYFPAVHNQDGTLSYSITPTWWAYVVLVNFGLLFTAIGIFVILSIYNTGRIDRLEEKQAGIERRISLCDNK